MTRPLLSAARGPTAHSVWIQPDINPMDVTKAAATVNDFLDVAGMGDTDRERTNKSARLAASQAPLIPPRLVGRCPRRLARRADRHRRARHRLPRSAVENHSISATTGADPNEEVAAIRWIAGRDVGDRLAIDRHVIHAGEHRQRVRAAGICGRAHITGAAGAEDDGCCARCHAGREVPHRPGHAHAAVPAWLRRRSAAPNHSRCQKGRDHASQSHAIEPLVPRRRCQARIFRQGLCARRKNPNLTSSATR